MIPPIWLSVRINWFWIPFPVFLLWPLFAIVWAILGAILTGILLGSGGNISEIGKIWKESWNLLCGFRGARVDVEHSQVHVKVSVL